MEKKLFADELKSCHSFVLNWIWLFEISHWSTIDVRFEAIRNICVFFLFILLFDLEWCIHRVYCDGNRQISFPIIFYRYQCESWHFSLFSASTFNMRENGKQPAEQYKNCAADETWYWGEVNRDSGEVERKLCDVIAISLVYTSLLQSSTRIGFNDSIILNSFRLIGKKGEREPRIS